MGTLHDKYISLPRCKQGLRCARWHFKMFRTINWPLTLYCHIKRLGMRPAFQASLMITPLDILPVLCFLIIQGIYLEAFYRPPTKLQEGYVSSHVCLSFCLEVPMWSLLHDVLDLTKLDSTPSQPDPASPLYGELSTLPPVSDIWWPWSTTCSILFTWEVLLVLTSGGF